MQSDGVDRLYTRMEYFTVCRIVYEQWMCITEVTCGRHEERLIDEIFKVRRYQKLARPVRKESEAVDVVFGLTLQQIISVVSRSLCVCGNVRMCVSLFVKAKFHYASWFGAGSEHVRS